MVSSRVIYNFSFKTKMISAGADPVGGAPPLKLEKILFFGVKSWFFTRNTPKMFAPPSARRNFFKCAPPNLKSWIRPWSHMDHFTRSLTHKNKIYIFISFDAVTSKSFIQMYSVRYIHYTVLRSRPLWNLLTLYISY